jgi:predicted TIM-barrel fold metal-dependent hydrolase
VSTQGNLSMSVSFDTHLNSLGSDSPRRIHPLAPDPAPRPVWRPMISADDHLLEPEDLFVGRVPARFNDSVPRVVEDAEGLQYWQLSEEQIAILGSNAVVSWAPHDQHLGPVRFDEVRRATWDPKLRAEDMDTAGVVASLCFPSMVFGFAGQRLITSCKDPAAGLALIRAYNDWVRTGWMDGAPGRFIGCQLAWLPDPVIAAEEIRSNANRGFVAVSFPENPEKLGYPSIYSGHWNPFLAACQETQTVVNLHVGSSSQTFKPSSDSATEVVACMFPLNALAACADWLYAGVPVRFPELRITMSESGIAWVPYLLDRLEFVETHIFKQGNDGGLGVAWPSKDISPTEALQRNFWFTSFFDPTAYRLRDRIGTDRIMIEMDYPHPDSTWPDTQRFVRRQLEGLPEDEIAQITMTNVSDVYRFEADPELVRSFARAANPAGTN